MSDRSGQSSSTTAGAGDKSGGGNGGGGGGSGGSFASQPQRAKVRKQVWAGVLSISSASTNK
ncbi:PREDICTED: uncharacterized protein LOC106310454 [Brassica oleracea var. oleracea]|uniref:Uncharacterized protein n=1 Tax=Brassica oleracea var. oleracea TaxID=109376 RepID=A0A0D3DQH7_BRAOL|nr:PREDICTED: uncharacterized protein LOC106310454 [Brassica oleracea var. oleracea]